MLATVRTRLACDHFKPRSSCTFLCWGCHQEPTDLVQQRNNPTTDYFILSGQVSLFFFSFLYLRNIFAGRQKTKVYMRTAMRPNLRSRRLVKLVTT